MDKDAYRKLMKHLGNVGIGYPQTEDFLGILKKKLTPEEAEMLPGIIDRINAGERTDTNRLRKLKDAVLTETTKVIFKIFAGLILAFLVWYLGFKP